MIYGMAIAGLSLQDKLKRVSFFEETFLLADISMNMVLEILFLTFFDVDIQFVGKELSWWSYTTAKTLPITKRLKLIAKREFVAVVLDRNVETFVVYIAVLEIMSIYSIWQAWIILLFADKALVIVLTKYTNIANSSPYYKALRVHHVPFFDQQLGRKASYFYRKRICIFSWLYFWPVSKAILTMSLLKDMTAPSRYIIPL